MWIRRIGKPPAPLKSRIVTNDDGPGPANHGTTACSTAVLESTAVEEFESFVWRANYSTAPAQTTQVGVQWWIEVWTTKAGTEANHWEIGYSPTTAVDSTAKEGSGTTGAWSAASTKNFYFRVSETLVPRKGFFFELDRLTYFTYSRNDGGGVQNMFTNGDRGIGTSEGTSVMTTALFSDDQKVWRTNMWAGAKLAIIRGPGKGIIGDITANTSINLTVNMDGIQPTSRSEYVIYDTNEWVAVAPGIISGMGTSNIPVSVTAVNNVAYLGYGKETTALGGIVWATSAHKSILHNHNPSAGESQITFDSITGFHDPVTGPHLFAAANATGKVHHTTAPSASTVAPKWTTGILAGGTQFPFTNLKGYNNQMYAFKEDGVYIIRSERAEKLNIGLGAFPSSNTGRSVAPQNLFMLFTWSHSVERLHGGQVTDIGPGRRAGLKQNHAGPFSALVPYTAWTLGGIDAGAGDGRSAAMAWDGKGWHEFFRAPTTGYRLEAMHMQNNPEGNPRLWMYVGGELICQRWPKNTLNPRRDPNVRYQHEAVMETGTIDMNAVQLPKLFGKTYAVTRNLASSNSVINVEYQLDENIGSTKWTGLGRFSESPVDSLQIRRGDKRAIRMRYRAVTQESTVPSIMEAAVVKAVARTPVRRQWSIRAVTGDFQVDNQGLQDADPDDFYMWLQDAAVSAEPVLMKSAWAAMDGIYVYVEHPILNRLYTTPAGEWGGQLHITIREMDED
jgi:hypothetical protein